MVENYINKTKHPFQKKGKFQILCKLNCSHLHYICTVCTASSVLFGGHALGLNVITEPHSHQNEMSTNSY